MIRVEIEKILVVHAHVRDGEGLGGLACLPSNQIRFNVGVCTGENQQKVQKALPIQPT